MNLIGTKLSQHLSRPASRAVSGALSQRPVSDYRQRKTFMNGHGSTEGQFFISMLKMPVGAAVMCGYCLIAR